MRLKVIRRGGSGPLLLRLNAESRPTELFYSDWRPEVRAWPSTLCSYHCPSVKKNSKGHFWYKVSASFGEIYSFPFYWSIKEGPPLPQCAYMRVAEDLDFREDLYFIEGSFIFKLDSFETLEGSFYVYILPSSGHKWVGEGHGSVGNYL